MKLVVGLTRCQGSMVFRNRVGAVLTWAAAFARDARGERTSTIQQVERLRDVYDSGRDRPTVPS